MDPDGNRLQNVVVPDTGGTGPCIECPQYLGLQLLFRVTYSGSYTLDIMTKLLLHTCTCMWCLSTTIYSISKPNFDRV